jgi:dTDP-4-amino-4,6-dideoxygalactose transaminase
MLYRLPPAGNPVVVRPVPAAGAAEAIFAGWRARFYASGTTALAAVLLAAARRCGREGGEAILPAYGCPDLVSATVRAGLHPVLADLAADRPWLDPEAVRRAVSPRTVAVVAVDLFGIPERLERLREAVGPDVCVIEDAAQCVPAAGDGWRGDPVVLSFGRGKPVGLLGGGAVLTRDGDWAASLPDPGRAPGSPAGELRFRLRATLYNLLRHPRAYWLPAGLPFLKLGQTRFVPLDGIESLDEAARCRLPANLARYRSGGDDHASAVGRMVAGLPVAGLVDLPAVCGAGAGTGVRLLRYPLLLPDAAAREHVLGRLTAAGLGATRMYPDVLRRIPGVAPFLGGGADAEYGNAESFARRLLTLPVHGGVGAAAIARMRDRIAGTLAEPRGAPA